MSYVGAPDLNATPPTAGESAIRSLLEDLAGRKEFCAYDAPARDKGGDSWAGFGAGPVNLFLPGLRLNGAQLFIRNFMNPDTDYMRLLIQWQTGTGKSIAAISIGHEFIRQFRARAALGERAPTIFVISFTARETIQEDMLRYPEFGFVSQTEVEELRRLRVAANAMGPTSGEARQLSGFIGTLRRRITDRARGGYYQFYGYKEFANRLFIITPQGISRGFDVQSLYSRSEGTFGEQLAEASARGDIRVNEELLDELRGGLLIADENQEMYNLLETNNYGIAIQYVLDALGANAPRAVFMSATPMTGSAAEIVDLLNLLVPRAALPGGVPLRRSDFFSRTTAPSAAVTAKSTTIAANDDPEMERLEPSTFVVSQLREGALEKIARFSAGRVSYLLDADVGSYPRRIFVGEEVPAVPYLRLTCCPMSAFHARTLEHEQREQQEAREGGEAEANAAGVTKTELRNLQTGAFTLYDMVFPNPGFAPDAAEGSDPNAVGLYRSGETLSKLLQAPEDWRNAAGVITDHASELSGITNISGAFLSVERLHLYSAKYAAVLRDVLAALKSGPGKMMIYHPRVRMSGVLILQEILRMNGFADENSVPTDSTRCAICGVARSAHDAANGHTYVPARFVVAHSVIDRILMLRSIARYNATSNLEGYQFRVIIGSKIIEKSLNFRAVRHQFVVSLPVDFPTLLQVFGRVVRKNSHIELPADQRDVRISIYLNTHADGRPSPELKRYIDKGSEYLVIQVCERALHINAVDGFANWGRIRSALGWVDGREPVANLDALPYAPLVGPGAVPAMPQTATFEAYDHGEREVAVIASICRVLFRARPVWTYDDLWAAVRAGAVQGVNYNATMFDEGNFAQALESLGRPAGEPPTSIVCIGDYYVRARTNADGTPCLDIETYLRDFPSPAVTPARVSIKVSDYLRESKSGQSFAVRLREYEQSYLSPDSTSTPELSLVEFGAEFHYALLRRFITAEAGDHITSDDTRVKELYRRFRLVVTRAKASIVPKVFRGSRSKTSNEIVGYVTPDAVSLYDHTTSVWYSASHADFGIGRRHTENDIIVGFVAPVGPTRVTDTTDRAADSFAATGAEARFKIRLPIRKLKLKLIAGKHGDVRTLARGGVCETRPREELELYAKRLREAVTRIGIEPQETRGGDCAACESIVAAPTMGGLRDLDHDSTKLRDVQLGYASKFDRAARQRFPSATTVCDTLRLHLLALEENARAPDNGMTDGIRWLYLYCDRAPSISALLSSK